MYRDIAEVPDALLDRQRQLWLQGSSPQVEDLLQECPDALDSESLLDLVYNEVVVKEELGLNPTLGEYLERYPQLEDDLRLHFEVHQAVNQRILLDTSTPHAENSWPETKSVLPANLLPDHDYEIERLIGQGGMAVVYHARHRRLKRDVALKLFQSSRPLTSREIARIRTEAEATARLAHANITPIFEIGEHQGMPFLALEFAAGGTLAERLRQSPMTADAAAQLIESLATAVQHAHERDILHRDLKPANILFTSDGTPKITDFGLAKLLEDRDVDSTDVTRTGEAIGTPRYMAPEQAAGQHETIGPATDVYALGTLLYECLTGRAPFVSAHVQETLQQIREADPVPPRRLQPSIPRDLETICLHCLEKEPRRRYSSAQGLAADLQRYRDGKPILARPTPHWEHAWKWCRRKPAQAGLIVMMVFLSLGSLLAAVVVKQRQATRIDGLRKEVAYLVRSGRSALDREELEAAQSCFHDAWLIVQSEPDLSDHETSVTGWLDHSRNALNRYQWKQRVPPRDFDDRRDEALLLAMLPFPNLPAAIEVARAAIDEALELTLPHDFAWQVEREQLVLLEAALIARQSGAADAITYLDGLTEFDSRRFHDVRSSLLDQLQRPIDAEQARRQADLFPVQAISSRFQDGMDAIKDQSYEQALSELEFVLAFEPEHFAARFFQSLCFLRLDRPAEAKVALTACLAQRPRFAWNYLLRGQAHAALGEVESANRDFESTLAGRPSDALREVMEQEHLVVRTIGRDMTPSDSTAEVALPTSAIVP